MHYLLVWNLNEYDTCTISTYSFNCQLSKTIIKKKKRKKKQDKADTFGWLGALKRNVWIDFAAFKTMKYILSYASSDYSWYGWLWLMYVSNTCATIYCACAVYAVGFLKLLSLIVSLFHLKSINLNVSVWKLNERS